MSKPILLLDVDGVFVYSNESNMARVNTHFGTDYKFENITTFSYDFMRPEHRQYIYDVCWNDPTLYDSVELSQDILITLERLRQIVRVVACSSPMVGHIRSKYAFLSKHFDRANIILASDKSIIDGDILVDDGPHNIEAFPAATIVFDRPWNQELINWPRVETFPEIYAATKILLSNSLP